MTTEKMSMRVQHFNELFNLCKEHLDSFGYADSEEYMDVILDTLRIYVKRLEEVADEIR